MGFALGALCFAQSSPQLLVWINGDKGYNGLQKVGDNFTAQTGVRVVVQHPESAPDKFQQAASAGKGPDIFCWPHDRTGEWSKSGLIVPIRPGKRVLDEIEPAAWDAFRFQGRLWGYPLALEAIGLIYNRALVPTPPASFEEVIALHERLRPQGKRAVLWEINSAFFTWPLLAASGGYVFGQLPSGDANVSDIGINNAGALRGAEMLAELIRVGVVPKGTRYADMEASFSRGEAAMMISGPWAWENARKARIDFAVAPVPGIGGKPGRPFVGVLGCMLSAASRSRDIAREFIENHLLRPEQLKLINDDVPLGVPANKAFYAALSSDPLIRATMANARLGAPIPNAPETGRLWGALDAALQAITNGMQPPREALDGAAVRMRAR